MERKTPLYDLHVELGGRIVPFAGYLLPVQYPKGVIHEHMAVREGVGLFDVSHMGEVRFEGAGALKALQSPDGQRHDRHGGRAGALFADAQRGRRHRRRSGGVPL